MAKPPSLHLRIASQRAEAQRVYEALDGLLRRLALEDEARDRIDLAVREAVANAVVHGNREDMARSVWFSAAVTADSLVIRVEDEGDGFELSRVADPRSPERLLLTHGRGLWLMQTLVDEFVMERRPEGGTSVVLRVRLARTVQANHDSAEPR